MARVIFKKLSRFEKQLQPQPQHNPIDFKLKLITNPTMGPTVGVYIPNFRFINAHVEVSSEMLEDFKLGH